MSRITVDAELAAKLGAEAGRVQLCDADGNVLGSFEPKPDPRLYDLEPKISEEELLRREQSNDYVPMEDVLRELRSM